MTNKNTQNPPSVLIVEDQAPLEGLIDAVEKVMPRHYPSFSKGNYVAVQCFKDAQNAISNNCYDIVILDHRMPIEDQSQLQKKDFNAFCKTLVNIGYSLIPEIKAKNPDAVVIGTSSLERDELRYYSTPDFRLEKVSGNVSEDLEKIILQIGGKK